MNRQNKHSQANAMEKIIAMTKRMFETASEREKKMLKKQIDREIRWYEHEYGEIGEE